MYSAWPPCTSPPVPFRKGQNILRPRWHHSQRPQVDWIHAEPTRSPTLRMVTSGATATISPPARGRGFEEIGREDALAFGVHRCSRSRLRAFSPALDLVRVAAEEHLGS